MQTYQTWAATVPMEYIEAGTGFEARKAFAAKHRLSVTECMARRMPAAMSHKWRTEFPDFPAADMPEVPAELMDSSWHNDMCPSFTSDALGLILFVDYADRAQREFSGGSRFVLSPQDHGVEVDMANYLETDNWDDVIDGLKRRIVSRIAELRPRAESGEQWAHLCALEAAYVAMTGEQLPR